MDSKKLFMLGFTAAGGAASMLTGCTDKQEEKRMNIIYIMCDDHSYQTISAYDNRYIETPNIDRIAEMGATFTRSYVANSLSGPSRACMITGKHSFANGFLDNETTFDGDQQTFPKLLQQAGYQTAMVGKWHLVSRPQGFDFWKILNGQGEYYNPNILSATDTVKMTGYATDVITDIALDWIDGRDKEKPFCLLLHHKAPHRSWEPDIQDLELFSDTDFPLPDNFYDDYEGRTAAGLSEMSIAEDMGLTRDLKIKPEVIGEPARPRMGMFRDRYTPEQRAAWNAHYDRVNEEFAKADPQGEELVQWKFNQYMRDYLRCITSVDRNVGRVLDYLEENNLMDNTVIVYTSDQGFYMGEHGWFDKRFMYEESMRTPMLVYYPGGVKGEVDHLVQNIDHAATFLEVAGVEVPSDIHGESLLPIYKGKNPKKWRDALYYHYYEFPSEHAVRKHFGIRTDRYKLIRFYWDERDEKKIDRAWGLKDREMALQQVNEWELYDLQEDPGEMNNIYGQPGTEELTATLKAKLKDLQASYGEAEFWCE